MEFLKLESSSAVAPEAVNLFMKICARIILMKIFFTKSWLRVLSGLFTNLSAGMLGVVIIAPNFLPLDSPVRFLLLTYDLIFAIVFLIIAVFLDEKL